LANSGDLPCRAAVGIGFPVTRAAAAAPFQSKPSDPPRTPKIRTCFDPIWTVGSRSSGRNPKIPVRPVPFAKETLLFLEFNPQSIVSQN